MDDSSETPSREIGSDLLEITARLGEPDSVHQTNRSKVIWRLILGFFLIIVSAILHYLFWTGEIPWPAAKHFKIWAIILIAGLVGPGGGIALISFAIRSMKMWVLVYPAGLFIWHRGTVLAFPWDQIVGLQIDGLPKKATFEQKTFRGTKAGYYDFSKAGGRLFGTSLDLVRVDQQEASIPSVLDGFAELCERIQLEIYQRIFPVLIERLIAGETIDQFGTVSLNNSGITIDHKSLSWMDFDRMERVGEEFYLFQKSKKRVWKKVAILETTNLHLFVGVVEWMQTAMNDHTQATQEETSAQDNL